MPSLTIKGIPDDLIVRLRCRAEQHGRSLDSEVILLLEEALGVRARTRSEVLKEIAGTQRHMPYVEHKAVSDHIKHGRT